MVTAMSSSLEWRQSPADGPPCVDRTGYDPGGVWHQRHTGGKLAITVEPLHGLTAAQRRELDDEIELVGAVMQAKPTLTLGTVTVGPPHA
jgi:hypothetical protein